MDTGSLKQCKDGSQGMGWRLPANNNSKYISNVTVSVEGDDSIIKITASPDFFGENVTLIYDCSVAEGRVDCPISAKSSCLEKGLCSAGVYDVEPDDSIRSCHVEPTVLITAGFIIFTLQVGYSPLEPNHPIY